MDADNSGRVIRGTPFYPRTSRLNERQKWNAWDQYHLVDFYTDWRDEHRRIREEAVALDMTPLAKHYVLGPDAERFVDYLIPRDATKIGIGQIYFTPWCNDEGQVVGDGMVMRLEEDKFLFSSDPMMRWFEANASGFDVTFEDVTHDFGILALQGPKSKAVLEAATGEDWSTLRFSRLRHTTIGGVDVMVARQGFTGEHGYELWMDADGGVSVWDALFESGTPLGLSVAGNHAADVARIEAGLVIPGSDYTPAAIDPGGDAIPQSQENRTTPLELNMGYLIDFDTDSDFIGKAALQREMQAGSKRRMVGIVLNWPEIVAAYVDAGIPPEISPRVVRFTMPILRDGTRVGRTTSVTWSPTLGKLIGYGHVDSAHAHAGTPVTVDWRRPDIRVGVTATISDLPHYELRRSD